MLLSAYTGEENVVFGTVFSARSSSATQATAFPAISTIPVVCKNAAETAKVIAQMVEYNATASRHRFTPLSELQQIAGDVRRALFDTVFVYQKITGSRNETNALSVLRETASVEYTVSMELEMTKNGRLAAHLTYNTSKVTAEHAQLLLAQYESKLGDLLGHPLDTSDSKLYSIVPARTPRLPSKAAFLHDFVELSADEYPDRPALEFISALGHGKAGKKIWTYRALNERANQLAHRLRQEGIIAGSIVATRMDKCAEASISFIAILKAGCSFLALDPELPQARQEFILKDSGAAALLVDPPGAKRQQAGTPVTIVVQECELANQPTKNVVSGLQDVSATCYCLYTSGTTGTPKGCEISHENAVQAILAFQKLFEGRWTESSRWLQFASYWFDVSVLEHFWSWSVGITMVGASRDMVLEDLSGSIQSSRITHIALTPSLARLVDPEDVPSLHGGVFITGGEALKQEIIDSWGLYSTVCNFYGPTETTIGVTSNTFLGCDAKSTNIGRPFSNVGVFVLQPNSDQAVLRGAVGELCVSGKLVGKGYLNRPDLTSKAFQYLDRYNETVYRTGDLVRLLAGGSISFVGRKDTQSKLRGQRLEVAEIDSVIKSSSPLIEDAHSLVIKSDDEVKQTLVSFCTSGGPGQRRKSEIDHSPASKSLVTKVMDVCRGHLPGYMVPTHIVPLTTWPLTVNNKIDSKQLIKLYSSMTTITSDSQDRVQGAERPLNEAEKIICTTVATMLKLDRSLVQRHTNFFSLGLSSVSAITLASLLKRCGVRTVSVGTIMQYPTIFELAAATGDEETDHSKSNHVREALLSLSAYALRHRTSALRTLKIPMHDIEAITPCTGLQTGLLLECIRQPERPYFNEFRYRLRDVNHERLRRAFERIVAATQILRARFVQSDDGFVQVILKNIDLPWHHVRPSLDVAVCHMASMRLQWCEMNSEQITQPFQVVIYEHPGWSELVLYAHHAIYDGTSWDLMMDALAEAYKNNSTPDCGPRFTDVLPHGPICHMAEAERFWRQRMEGFRHQPLRKATSDPGDTITANLCIKDMAGIEQLRKDLGVSHQALLQACFEVAIKQPFSDSTSYGQVVSGRSIAFERADCIIGPLFNTIPVVLSVDPGDSWASLIRRCHQMNTTLLPYQHTPLRDIRKWCGWSSTDSIFDVLFVFQHSTKQPLGEKYDLWSVVEQPPRADYPLSLELTMMPNATLQATIVAQADVVDHNILEAMLGSFVTALSAVGTDPDRSIAQDFTISSKVANDSRSHEARLQPYLNGVHNFSWTEQALKLRSTIAQIAGVQGDVVDEHTSIFALGMDSIDAVKLASRAKKSGFVLPVSKILQCQTIARMLEAIGQSGDNAVSDGDLNDRLVEQSKALFGAIRTEHGYSVSCVEKVLPATPSQEALVADMIRSDFQDYYNHDVLELDSQTDVRRLNDALQQVVNGSSILRTGFYEVTAADVDATFAQVIWPSSFIQIQEAAIETDIETILRTVTEEVKGCRNGQPLLRLMMASNTTNRYLIISLAHAQYDGHSLALLHEDIWLAYGGEYVLRPPYEGSIQQAISSTEEAARKFWSSSFSEAQRQPFPQRAALESGEIVHRAEKSSKLSSATVRSFCQANSISVQALAQTCWSLVLASHTKALEVTFGVVLACRDSEEAERIMFPMMNTVPVRAALHGTKLEILRAMQSSIDDMRPYQRTPLRTIQAVCSDAAEDRSGSGLFDALFIYQHRPEARKTRTHPLYKSVGGRSSVEYPVAVEMEAVGDNMLMRCACKSSVLDEEGTNNLLNQLDTVLESIVNTPTEPTVTFREGGQVSIGTLPAFTLTSNTTDKPVAKPIGPTNVQDGLSATALLIRETLAQVAKVPADSISPIATIETIGIDSISAIKVAAVLRKKSIRLPVSEILRARTIHRMAEAAESMSKAKEPENVNAEAVVVQVLQERGLTDLSSRFGIDLCDVQAVLPATAGQVYMLSTWLQSAGQLFYPTFSYEIQTSLGEDRLRHAWEQLVKRHDVLRTVFCATNDSSIPAVQVVFKSVPGSFNTDIVQQSEARVLLQPMVSLFTEQTNKSWLLKLTIHHALYDAVSLPLLMQDYSSLLNDKEPVQLSIQSADVLALSITEAAQDKQREFWRSYFKDLHAPALKQPTISGAQNRVELFKPGLFSDTAGLESVARQEGVTIQALLFATYAKVYLSLTTSNSASTKADGKEHDVFLGIYLSNRSHLPDLDKLAAPTLNLVPLRVRHPATKTILGVAREIQRDLQAIGTAENSAVGLWRIKEWTGAKIDTFVNFLKLPEGVKNDEVERRGGTVVLREMVGRRREGYARVAGPGDDHVGFTPPKALSGLKVKDAYSYSLDLEATVTNGRLDLGLFCPEEMLGLQEAQDVMVELECLLEKLVGKAKE
ncbi:NRPS [Recurvomyces mirabilis]|uniref:NRPS n=1 Tax=Recurvomyces mirabilis TaxID=574656 RepID=A0AAE0WW75_9PEZI|nr:NRPS [Recurvomyces mirabilis]KAK5159019.1 hypothetical protein LTS14_003127 [Recurvomyces mirabilis]